MNYHPYTVLHGTNREMTFRSLKSMTAWVRRNYIVPDRITFRESPDHAPERMVFLRGSKGGISISRQ
jgi:hypothetical protein